MKALKATVEVLLDPRVIGRDASTEWSGPNADASAADFMSAVLSQVNGDTVLDWRYVGNQNQFGTYWTEVDVDPDNYEEGDFDNG